MNVKSIKSSSTKWLESFVNKIQSSLKSINFSLWVCWKSSRLYFSIRLCFELLFIGIPIISAYLSKLIMNTLVSFANNPPHTSNIKALAYLLILSFLFQLFNLVFGRISQLIAEIHQDLIGNFIELQTSRKIVSLDISCFDSSRFHNELANARKDSSSVPGLSWSILTVFRSIGQIFTTGIILFRLSPLLPCILILLNLPSIITERHYSLVFYRWSRKKSPEQRKMNYILNILTGANFAKDVRIYNLKDELFRRYSIHWRNWFKEKRKISNKRILGTSLASLVPMSAYIGISFFLGVKIANGYLTIGDYTFYNGLIGQFNSSISALIGAFSSIYEADIRIANYRKFLDIKPLVIDEGNLIPSGIPCIEFQNVSFKYPGTERYVLNNVSFKINSGEKVALVGLNGAGKSTIVKLTLRLYDVNEGTIFIDGRNIKEYKIDELRKCFSVQFQDFCQYAFTARETITISDYEKRHDEKSIEDACKISGAGDMINNWPDGLETFLTRQFDEGGMQLSGGQWQKIALAQAFFKNGNIIILDEPSSALDPEAEKDVFEQMARLCDKKGAIFISHRLSNVTMADKIVVIENGELVECGSYTELLSINGRFAYLFNLQAEKYLQAYKDAGQYTNIELKQDSV